MALLAALRDSPVARNLVGCPRLARRTIGCGRRGRAIDDGRAIYLASGQQVCLRKKSEV